METIKTTGQNIREHRTRLGLSARGLASRAGVAPSTITHAERHEHTPHLANLVKIARALGVELHDLI
jgi:transcriptional regulator with XRE-family HTH domain